MAGWEMKLDTTHALDMLLQILGGFFRAEGINDIIPVISHEICVYPYVLRNVKLLSHGFWIWLCHEVRICNIFKC